MRLYGQYGLNGMHGLQSSFGSLRGLAPKKKDKGPPVAGYFAWFQAKDRTDLTFDGDTVVGWEDRGPNRFLGSGGGIRTYAPGKGVIFGRTSSFDSGYLHVPNALDRIAHLFVAVGGWGNTYGGVLCHPSDQNYNILQANDPSRFFTSWAGGTGIRINGVQTNEMVANDNAIISNSTGSPDNNGVNGHTLMIGNAPGDNNRNYFGGIGEIILYQKKLSDAERDATERWLAARWGILGKF